MERFCCLFVFAFILSFIGYAQEPASGVHQRRAVIAVVDQYEQAREASDTALLRRILTDDVDQLVSSGIWRRGIAAALEGMLRSSANNPGERSLEVENVRFLHPACALADARYEIRNADGSVRRMWSTFMVVNDGRDWKIAAIRNMLPAGAR